jgi:hypothetical protein
MIELAIRVTNYGAAVNIGGDVVVITYIVSVEHPQLEKLLKPEKWETKTISVVDEEEKECNKKEECTH